MEVMTLITSMLMAVAYELRRIILVTSTISYDVYVLKYEENDDDKSNEVYSS